MADKFGVSQRSNTKVEPNGMKRGGLCEERVREKGECELMMNI